MKGQRSKKVKDDCARGFGGGRGRGLDGGAGVELRDVPSSPTLNARLL